MQGRFLFLGTGASLGVPVIGCDCRVCSSGVSRLRSSGLLTVKDQKFLIDAGPDFRQQALKYGLGPLQGIFFTHLHYDHIAGCDDLRSLYYAYHQTTPCLLSQQTLRELKLRFHYLFEGRHASPFFDFHVLEEECGICHFVSLNVTYVSYHQEEVQVTGFRVGDFAYLTDVSQYEEKIFPYLKGVKTLVLSLVRMKTSSLHLGLLEIIAFAQKVGADKVLFTHISHEIDKEKVTSLFPPQFSLASDGEEISFHVED